MTVIPRAVRLLRLLGTAVATYVVCWHIAFIVVQTLFGRSGIPFSTAELIHEYWIDLPSLWPAIQREEVAAIQVLGLALTAVTLLAMIIRSTVRRLKADPRAR